MQPTFIDEHTRHFDLNPGTSALIIVDMQYASGSRDHGLGRLLANQGRLLEAKYRFDRIENMVIPNIQRLQQCFRHVGSPVIYVTLGPTLADYGDAPKHLRDWFEATNNHVGTREHEIVDELKPLPGELVVNKVTMGAFASTALESHLKGMGIEEIVVTGVSTNNCVGMTAMEASDRQFGVAVVSDGSGTCSEEMQAATLKTLMRLWGRVLSTDEVIAEMTGGTVRSAAGAGL